MEFLSQRESPMSERDARMMDVYSFRPVESVVDGAFDGGLNVLDDLFRTALYGIEVATLVAPAAELSPERQRAFGDVVVTDQYIPSPEQYDAVNSTLWTDEQISAQFAGTQDQYALAA